MGLQSLPVAFGIDTAKWICVSTIDVTQLGVAAYLAFGLHETTYAAVLLGLILPQVRSAACVAAGSRHAMAWQMLRRRAAAFRTRGPARAARARCASTLQTGRPALLYLHPSQPASQLTSPTSQTTNNSHPP